MKIKDVKTNQIFNVSTKSIINTMLSNPKKYVEVKEAGKEKPAPKSTVAESKEEDNEE